MSKRFTATNKWEDPWFFNLTSGQKLFWIYLLDRCDHAGIWLVNMQLVKFYLGEIPDLFPFNGRYEAISDEKWFIPKFIEFQYGELRDDSRTHASVIAILKKQGVWEGYARSIHTPMDKDKAKDKAKDKEYGFEKFWSAYPKKKSKGDAEKSWKKLSPSNEQIEAILSAIDRAKTSKDWQKDGGQFIPYPASWLNAKGWEDDHGVELQGRREVVI